MVLTAACSGTSSSASSSPSGGASGGASGDDGKPRISQATVKITPADGASNLDPDKPVEVTVSQGKLTSVTVTSADNKAVAGTLSADGSSWTPDTKLALSTKYRVSAVAEDGDGLRSEENSSFTTKSPEDTFIGYFTPEDNSTVGVGMPVSINFNRQIKDRAAVEKAIKVTANPNVEIAPHWFSDQRLDFRPRDYWAAGTEVTLSLRLKDVKGAPGVYGVQSKDVHFTVGRSQVSMVDVATRQMQVKRSGQVIRTIPISAGSPQNTTYNGKMVISEKYQQTRMNGDTVGFGGEYDIKDVPHAMRLSTSGTFVHGNYWGASSIFGTQNTSHGCVGLRDVKGANDPSTPAAWFYNHSLIGDVVEVVNSVDKIIAPDNGLNGWNMDWASWKAGSAVTS